MDQRRGCPGRQPLSFSKRLFFKLPLALGSGSRRTRKALAELLFALAKAGRKIDI
jgi:hypothetical protein